MSAAEVNRIRDNSEGYKAAKRFQKKTPWESDYVEMGKKTVIRRLCKFMPKSPELAAALALDNVADRGRDQNITTEAAIEGTWAPTDDDPSAPEATREEPRLPDYPEADFAKNLAGWRKTIASKKRTADDVIAMLKTKHSLSAEQEAAIREGPKAFDPAAALVDVKAKAEAAALTDTDVAKAIGAKKLDPLTEETYAKALAFIADPTGGAS
jgi:hypothetical protein